MTFGWQGRGLRHIFGLNWSIMLLFAFMLFLLFWEVSSSFLLFTRLSLSYAFLLSGPMHEASSAIREYSRGWSRRTQTILACPFTSLSTLYKRVSRHWRVSPTTSLGRATHYRIKLSLESFMCLIWLFVRTSLFFHCYGLRAVLGWFMCVLSAVFMGVDMFTRLSRSMDGGPKAVSKKKVWGDVIARWNNAMEVLCLPTRRGTIVAWHLHGRSSLHVI